MSEDLYQEIIIEEYQHPHHKGEMLDADVKVTEHNASCGDEITIFVKFNKDRSQITELSWVGDGCAISVATTSLLTRHVLEQHMPLDQIATLQKKDLENLLGISQIAYGREKCLTIGLNALQKAVESR